jgi:hypothetical protein
MENLWNHFMPTPSTKRGFTFRIDTTEKEILWLYLEQGECALWTKKAKNLEDLYHIDSDPLIENLSYFFIVEADRLLAEIIRNSRLKLKGRRWNLENKSAGSVSLNVAQSPTFSVYSPSRRTLQSVLSTVYLKTGINISVFCAYSADVW